MKNYMNFSSFFKLVSFAILLVLFAVSHLWCAVGIDVTVSGDGAAASTTVSTPIFSTNSTNELLLAFVSTDYTSGTNTTVTNITGGTLTWALVKRSNAQSGTSEVWRAFASSPLSGVGVTATLSQKVFASITVIAFSGVDTSGTNGSGAVGATASGSASRGAPTASLVTTRNNSRVLGVGNDFDNPISRTPGSGQSLIHQYKPPVGDTYWVQAQNAATPLSGTTVTINDTAPTADRFNLVIVEVLSSLGGGGSTFTISGTISPSSSGSGATVSLSGATNATVTADTSGNYVFAGLANGSYTVTPSKPGFTFSPISQAANVNGANLSGINFAGRAQTWSLSGTISPSSAAVGTTITLSGTSNSTVAPDASGNYSFTGLTNGPYTVTPSKAGFTFTPASSSLNINDASITGISFTASSTAQTWTVSGAITPSAAGSGATVALTGATNASTVADSSGNFTLTGLSNGSYILTPSKAGFYFSPTSQPVNVNGTNLSGVKFTGTAQTWSISGTISPAAGGVGATVTLAGTSSASAIADSSGSYSFTGLANGAYTITPSNGGYTFTPTNQSVTLNGSNVVGINFTDQPAQPASIQLIQAKANGSESSVSNISATFASNNTAGNFLLVTGTAARPNGTLSISDTAGNTYLPAMGPVTDPGQDVTAYIWYVPNCKGGSNTVALTPTSSRALEIHISEWSGLAVTSSLDQTSSSTGTGNTASSLPRTTTANGELIFGYSFLYNTASAGVGFSGMSLVNGDLDEYQIQNTASSVAATFTQTSGTWFALMATFKPAASGSVPGWNISGNISPPSAATGATVTLSGAANASTNPDAAGNYVFTGLANGSYSVTPSEGGYIFSPASRFVTVNGATVANLNFTAQTAGTAMLAVDATTSQTLTSKATTVSTAAFSTNSGNELLLAFMAADYDSGTNTTVTNMTGGGLTWTLVKRTNVQSGTAEIWRAFAATTLSGVTVAATLSQSVVSSITVVSFSGADTTGSNGSGAIGATASASAGSGAPSASLTTTRNNSLVLGVGNDFDNAIPRAAGSAQSLVYQVLASIGDTYWVQRQNNPTPVSGTSVPISDTAPTGDRYNLSIVEVLPAVSGGVATPPSVSMTAPAQNATVSGQTTISATATDPYNSILGVQFLLDGNKLGAEVTSVPYSLTWDVSSLNGTHNLAAIAYNSAGLNATSTPITVTVDNSGNGAVIGSWSSVVNLPTVAVNLILLKNNKLLFYEDGATATVWDYGNNTFTSVPTNTNLFCSGHAVLADGRVLVVGGWGGTSNPIGIGNAEVFDPSNNTWTAVPNMAYRRWYPTATTLSDGRVLVTAGWQTSNHSNAGIPEIYSPSTNSWTQLINANNPFETYPFIYQLPDGRLLHLGGSEYATDTEVLDLNTQAWSVLDPGIVDGGSSAMYQPGKIMKAGSAADSQSTGPASKTTFVLDMTQSSPAWLQTPSMVYPRSFFNLVTLPDDSVLAVGGETDRNGGNIANAVYAAEMWSPQSRVWTTMASMHTPREYHSTALLLPDGRVVVSGMGADFGNVPDQKNAEFYSPPYLFKGARPVITQAPQQIQYRTNFFVSTPDGATITSASLIRTGAVTHFFDQNARFVPVTFQQTSGGLTVSAPADANLAPPGYYMFFIVNSNGVPSVAPIVQVGP